LLQRAIADVRDLAGFVLVRAPPVRRTAAGPTRPLPLGLRRQNEVVAEAIANRRTVAARLRSKPPAEGDRVGVADVHDRMIVARREAPHVARVLPVRARPMLPFALLVVGVAAAAAFAVGDVPRRRDESGELPVRRLGLAEVERLGQRDLMPRPL